MPPGTLGEDGVKGAVEEFLSSGQQKDGQAFTASECHDTRFLASASGEAAKKVVILAERNSDAVPPIPMARTVLDTVQ